MLHLFKPNLGNSFSNGRNGGSTFEEAEEGKSDRKVVEELKDAFREISWHAKDLEAKAVVKFSP